MYPKASKDLRLGLLVQELTIAGVVHQVDCVAIFIGMANHPPQASLESGLWIFKLLGERNNPSGGLASPGIVEKNFDGKRVFPGGRKDKVGRWSN